MKRKVIRNREPNQVRSKGVLNHLIKREMKELRRVLQNQLDDTII